MCECVGVCLLLCAENLLSLSQQQRQHQKQKHLGFSQGNFFGVLMPFGYQLAIIRWILEPSRSSDASSAT